MTELTIACPKPAMSHVIGKGGETIKQLQQETGADIHVADGIVRIIGSAEQCADAEARVRAIIHKQANPDYVGEAGKNYRDHAESLYKQRAELQAEAQRSFDAGDRSTGQRLMAEAKKCGEDAQTANDKAAHCIMQELNHNKGDRYLDLHGLRVEEALGFVRERLDMLEKSTPKGTVVELELIPGAGHHSGAGGPKIRPALAEMLRGRNVAFSGEENVTKPIVAQVVGAAPVTQDPPPAAAAAAGGGGSAPAARETEATGTGAIPGSAPAPKPPKTESKSKCCAVM
jgi:hypothetical protein